MKRIVVHAGPPRTGTSAVQWWLDRHAEALEAQGVLYPRHPLDVNGVSSGNLDAVMDRQPGGRFAPSEDKVRRLLGEFAASDHPTLLLSSEFFADAIEPLDLLLPDASFVFYVRDPLEVLESGYKQKVERHGQTRPFPFGPGFRCRALESLDALLSLDPGPTVIVRPYGEGLFAGGTIVSDLMRVLGVGLAVEEDPRINASYTFEALELKRCANHFELGRLASALDRALQACPVGQKEYTLVPDDRHEAMRGRALDLVREVMERHHLAGLRPLLAQMERSVPRPHRPQRAEATGLAEVARWLTEAAPDVHAALLERVDAQPETTPPVQGFREALSSRSSRA